MLCRPALRNVACAGATAWSNCSFAGFRTSQTHAAHKLSSLSAWDFLLDTAVGMLQAGSLACVIYNYFMSTSVMVGASMWPTFRPQGDIVLVEKITHKWGKLMPGDIVTCISPDDPKQSICKRLAAVEGTLVAVPLSDGWSDPMARLLGMPQYEMLEVPRGHVWLLGDNSQVSYDSRAYGPVPFALITGRVFAQVWPPSRATLFPRPSSPSSHQQTDH